jgi:hypothetical protein
MIFFIQIMEEKIPTWMEKENKHKNENEKRNYENC